MGEVKQYECPKCGYTTPVLHFGCGFRDYYEVYICKACQTIQSSLVATEDCMSEFDEESELDNVNLVTVYGEDYNNKELVEYSKREKAKKCNHCSSQVISEIPYQIEIDFQNLTVIIRQKSISLSYKDTTLKCICQVPDRFQPEKQKRKVSEKDFLFIIPSIYTLISSK